MNCDIKRRSFICSCLLAPIVRFDILGIRISLNKSFINQFTDPIDVSIEEDPLDALLKKVKDQIESINSSEENFTRMTADFSNESKQQSYIYEDVQNCFFNSWNNLDRLLTPFVQYSFDSYLTFRIDSIPKIDSKEYLLKN